MKKFRNKAILLFAGRNKYQTVCFWASLLGCFALLASSLDSTEKLPPTPLSMNVNRGSTEELKISWVNGNGSISRTTIERSTGKQGIFTEIANVENDVVTYTDVGLAAGGTYCYRIRAYRTTQDHKQYSDYSSLVCASTASDSSRTAFVSEKEFYVSTDGTSQGDGSEEDPWDLQTALDHPDSVSPGDTIWLRGGTYKGRFLSQLRGEGGEPIIVRSFPGEWAKLDGGKKLSEHVLRVIGPNVHFRDIEITRSEFDRYQNVRGCGSVKGGIMIRAANVKIINCIVHDTSLGFGVWSNSPNVELYGNVVYYNGWIDVPNDNACDHGIYVQYKKIIKDNIVFRNFRTGITPHGTSAATVDDVLVEGNIIFSNGSIPVNAYRNPGANIWLGYFGGSKQPKIIQNPRMIENYTYYPEGLLRVDSFFLNFSTNRARVRRNYFIRGGLKRDGVHNGGVFDANVILAEGFRGNWTPKSEEKNMYFSPKDEPAVAIIRKNEFEPNRAHLVIYNFKKLDSFKVDVSDLRWKAGDTYELKNAQDYFVDVIKGTYDGKGFIHVPMTNHSVAPPVGWPVTPTTFPEFGAFVLIRQKQ